MVDSKTQSYQHAYRRVSPDDDDAAAASDDDVNQQVSKQDNQNRRRTKYLVAAGAMFIVILVALIVASSRRNSRFHDEDDDDEQKCYASAPSVIIDDSGIIEDGPGSDGICNGTVHWLDDQKVDHLGTGKAEFRNATWSQKYFINDDYWKGPGHPIFFIMGGEDEAKCLFYPFVTHTLARLTGGLTLEAEHRFYGGSQPVAPDVVLNDVTTMVGLLTPDQALGDYLYLLKLKQEEYGCSTDRTSPNYCPVVTVGASYPGFLAAMMRFVHPDVVDMAYASSAPLPLYTQQVDPNAYFNLVTQSTEHAVANCPAAIKATLTEIQNDLLDSEPATDDKADTIDVVGHVAQRLGICADELPSYIDSTQLLWHEILSSIAANFADFNMDNYPPGLPTNDLNRACRVFMNENNDYPNAYSKLRGFWHVIATGANSGDSHMTAADSGDEGSDACFDLHSQIPDGPRGRVTSSDWTGGGDGKSGLSWDFQCCTDLIVQASLGPHSMFPRRKWTLGALTEHCQDRFGVKPTPTRLVDKWHFDDLVGHRASRILFTNGLADGWSADSILNTLSPSLVTINMPNGAHHSDLNHQGPHAADTDDIRNAYPLIVDILTRWLQEVKNEALCQED